LPPGFPPPGFPPPGLPPGLVLPHPPIPERVVVVVRDVWVNCWASCSLSVRVWVPSVCVAMASRCVSVEVSAVQDRFFTSSGTSWFLVSSWGLSMSSVLVSDGCCSIGSATLDACLLDCLDRCWCLVSSCNVVNKRSQV
jgi:hypothetical protein